MALEDLKYIIEMLVLSNSECFLDKASIRFGCFTLSVIVDENDTVKEVKNKLLHEVESFYFRSKTENELRKKLNLE